ncbi:hypothetical protein PHYPO_G00099810 [Pangasianodon hypophthalmus]|uniref:Uncharacterized protein n=1 Tax=Pangasianodon hypophthalmus TaxID=310915 RepID=A0A5N5PXW7_PANHP|nr:hypothetical protein PHYPO_G00099810 [Pangasianodon hypophthalmus]
MLSRTSASLDLSLELCTARGSLNSWMICKLSVGSRIRGTSTPRSNTLTSLITITGYFLHSLSSSRMSLGAHLAHTSPWTSPTWCFLYAAHRGWEQITLLVFQPKMNEVLMLAEPAYSLSTEKSQRNSEFIMSRTAPCRLPASPGYSACHMFHIGSYR